MANPKAVLDMTNKKEASVPTAQRETDACKKPNVDEPNDQITQNLKGHARGS